MPNYKSKYKYKSGGLSSFQKFIIFVLIIGAFYIFAAITAGNWTVEAVFNQTIDFIADTSIWVYHNWINPVVTWISAQITGG